MLIDVGGPSSLWAVPPPLGRLSWLVTAGLSNRKRGGTEREETNRETERQRGERQRETKRSSSKPSIRESEAHRCQRNKRPK